MAALPAELIHHIMQLYVRKSPEFSKKDLVLVSRTMLDIVGPLVFGTFRLTAANAAHLITCCDEGSPPLICAGYARHLAAWMILDWPFHQDNAKTRLLKNFAHVKTFTGHASMAVRMYRSSPDVFKPTKLITHDSGILLALLDEQPLSYPHVHSADDVEHSAVLEALRHITHISVGLTSLELLRLLPNMPELTHILFEPSTFTGADDLVAAVCGILVQPSVQFASVHVQWDNLYGSLPVNVAPLSDEAVREAIAAAVQERVINRVARITLTYRGAPWIQTFKAGGDDALHWIHEDNSQVVKYEPAHHR